MPGQFRILGQGAADFGNIHWSYDCSFISTFL